MTTIGWSAMGHGGRACGTSDFAGSVIIGSCVIKVLRVVMSLKSR